MTKLDSARALLERIRGMRLAVQFLAEEAVRTFQKPELEGLSPVAAFAEVDATLAEAEFLTRQQIECLESKVIEETKGTDETNRTWTRIHLLVEAARLAWVSIRMVLSQCIAVVSCIEGE